MPGLIHCEAMGCCKSCVSFVRPLERASEALRLCIFLCGWVCFFSFGVYLGSISVNCGDHGGDFLQFGSLRDPTESTLGPKGRFLEKTCFCMFGGNPPRWRLYCKNRGGINVRKNVEKNACCFHTIIYSVLARKRGSRVLRWSPSGTQNHRKSMLNG